MHNPSRRGDALGAVLPTERVAFFAHDFAVLDPIEPGYSVRAPSTSILTTGAGEAKANAASYTNLEARVVVEDSDRIDLDTMEHTRQSRLHRWQDQR